MHATPHAESPLEGCTAFLAALDAVVDGEADTLSVARSEAHAAACVACAHRLAAARAYRERLRQVGERSAATNALRERVRRILQAVRGSPTR